MLFWTVIFPFVVALLLTRLFSDPGSRLYILDIPNARSLHSRPTPRTGGVAIVIGMLSGSLLYALVSLRAIPGDSDLLVGVTAVIAISFISYLDDQRHVSVVYRLTMQVMVAVLLVIAGLTIRYISLPGFAIPLPPWVATGLTVLLTIWMINLYNFMDGVDGLAGGMAVLGFGAFAFMGWMADHELFYAACLVVASASAGFLILNFPPARIFMGDTGSSTLGVLAAAFSLWGTREGIFPFWVAGLVFSPFIADATVTLLRRLWRRENIWHAHRSHYYQQLAQTGWGHRKTVLVEYAIMLGCAITAISSLRATISAQMAVLAGWALFYIVFFIWIARHASRQRHESA